jgi:hypothetical protein
MVPMKYSLRSLMTFSIRDLFWLMAVVALVLGWWVDRSRLATELKAFENEMVRLKLVMLEWERGTPLSAARSPK